MIVNKFPKKCQSCGKMVKPGEGFAYKNGYVWLTVCASSACHRQLGVKIDSNLTDQNTVKKITEDGFIYMPFDREAIPLLRSMPGAKFYSADDKDNPTPGKVCWGVSTKPADLLRVIEVCEQLKLEIPDSLRANTQTEESTAAEVRAERPRKDGKYLYNFQKIGVEFLALHNRALLADDMGVGKALVNGTKILTPTGLVAIEDLNVGDFVIGRNGLPTKVIGVYPQGKLNTFKVTFSDDRSILCSEDHLWAVQTPNWRVRKPNYFKPMSLKSIIDSGLEDHNGNRKWFIPVVDPVQYEEKQFPIHPYILGALIANGSLDRTPEHHGLPEQRAVLESFGIEFEHKDYDKEWSFVIKNNYIKSALKELGLWQKICYEKFIPEIYFYGSVSQRLQLLQGLVDNDGTVSPDGFVVEYNTSSKKLSDDVIRLVRSLGGVVSFSTRNPKFPYKGEIKIGSTDHRIRIKLPKDMCPVSIPFKANRFVANSKYPPALSIAKITDNGICDCTCIAVDAEDHLYVADNFIVTHNTATSLVALPESSRVIIVCPASLKYNWRDEIELWRPEYKITICNGRESFVLPENGEIVICNYDILPKYLLPSKKTGKLSKKGKEILEADLTEEQKQILNDVVLIADECHLVKNYKSLRAQKLSQITRPSKKVWFLSGTPLMNHPIDLFGVLSAGNMNPFGSWDNFLRLFNGYKNQWGGYEFGMPMPEVPERMKRVMLRRLKSEVLKDLPPKTYQDIEVDIDGSLAKKLDKFLDKAKNYDDLHPVDDNESLDIEELPSFSEFSEIRAMLAESRIPAMLEIVENYEASDTPLVVFSAHKAPIEALKDREGWKIITGDTKSEDRRNAVHDFQNGKLKGIALTIQAGGVGVTLTRASNALFVDLDWTPSWNIQSEDRLVRIGATGSYVLIMRMRSKHPLDLHIHKLLAHKIELAYKALEASINFKPPPPRLPGVAIVEETDEELMARINAAGKEAEREIFLGKLHGILGRESVKVNDVPEPELTTERKAMLRDALDYMISVCDGAETRDAMGFNKPDAHIARWVGHCLRDEDEVSYRVLERILVRYRRQLKGQFEEIWKPAF